MTKPQGKGGRPPQGERALTGAERQARYRQLQISTCTAPPSSVRPHRTGSRPQRWRAAVAELIASQAEYAAWLDRVPEPLRDSATGEALQAIIDLDLNELLVVELPRGFGRD